jgi:outer membrane receptor protein involved in Fe transport
LQAQGRSYAQNDGSAYVAGFGVQDMSLARKFWKVDVKVGVLNLANKTYEYTAGYPQRGRTWYGSLSFDL